MPRMRSLLDRWRYDWWQTGIPFLCKFGWHKGAEGLTCRRCGTGPL